MVAAVLAFLYRSPMALQVLLAAAGMLLVACLGLGITCRVVTAERDSALTAKAELAGKLQLQNQAVEAWRKEADSQKQRADSATQRAAAVQARTETRVERLLAAPVPAGCIDAVRWGAVAGAQAGVDWEDGK